ncbi:MAG: glucose-6-phosphate isomerase [Chloroflexi bacterium]|nr:glucose-6-phosphate isomerase [Chloroflexota bacterium]
MFLGRAQLGSYQALVDDALARLQRQDAIRRLWQHDHTLWKQEPTEIVDRLGWLRVTEGMRREVAGLRDFAQEVRREGLLHVVVLGMGGSSLGAEALRQAFGSARGSPALTVLDSTSPAAVRAATQAIDASRTLFLVSSKSGTTIEPLSFYRHFRCLTEDAVGPGEAGGHFVAITDPGTPLERLAQEQGFRRVFLNPQDIGGRYSVLSLFGLLPAALIGVDLEALLARADAMRGACGPQTQATDNPGAWLGAAMAALALIGRNKLTLVVSPAIASFGLWAEQLIAESTGKEGKGIVPVAGEPLSGPAAYGDDRFFVRLRLEGDDNASADRMMDSLTAAGQPVAAIGLRDRYDLGAEFFRWEFATALAGHLLGVHPFDQPDVQGAKEATDRLLARRRNFGSLPGVGSATNLQELLGQARPGDYLAIMAYLHQAPELDQALSELRLRVMTQYRIATTLEYGPRFLHSTGQLHKGGPNQGLFLQVTQSHAQDIPLPGEEYTFGVLTDAQALGDLHALQAGGRRVARMRLAPGYVVRLLRRLAEEVGE